MDVRRHLPLALPRRTVHLFGRYWVPLLTWYFVGLGVHDLLAEAGARIYVLNSVVAYSVLALGILGQLASHVMMFLVVQPALPTVWRLRGSAKRTPRELLAAVGFALLPFLLVYSAWNLFERDLNHLKYRTWELYAVEKDWGTAYVPAKFTVWFAVAAVAAWLLVKVCEGITRRTLNLVTAMLAAVFEANWMFFGIFGITTLLGRLGEWLRHTVAYQNLQHVRDVLGEVAPVLPLRIPDVADVLTLDFGWLDGTQGALVNGIALPLAWLAIAGACYGQEVEDVRTLVGERYMDRLDRAPNIVQRWTRRFPPEGVREKYYPPLHAVRLIGAAGLPAIMFFCVCYSSLELGKYLLSDLVAAVMGPHSPGGFWEGAGPLVSSVVEGVAEALRICLLAVTFDLGLSVFTERNAGTEETETAASATGT